MITPIRKNHALDYFLRATLSSGKRQENWIQKRLLWTVKYEEEYLVTMPGCQDARGKNCPAIDTYLSSDVVSGVGQNRAQLGFGLRCRPAFFFRSE